MKPIVLTAQMRQDIERRRKAAPDRRTYQRLTAVLAVAAGKPRPEVAELLGVSLTQMGEWLRLFRNQGLEALCTLHNKGDPGNLTAPQVSCTFRDFLTARGERPFAGVTPLAG